MCHTAAFMPLCITALFMPLCHSAVCRSSIYCLRPVNAAMPYYFIKVTVTQPFFPVPVEELYTVYASTFAIVAQLQTVTHKHVNIRKYIEDNNRIAM